MTSSGFAALLALSQAQTQESTRAADSIQAERRRKEETRRRQQEEEDRKEREQQAKMVRHQLEEQKREKERQLKREREEEAKLKEMERREEKQRQVLLYGPKKATKDTSSRHTASSSASKRTSGDDSDGDGGLALTREEKRERRLQLQFAQTSTRRAGSSAGTSRTGRRLPGGALNITSTSQAASGSANDSKSVRARLAAMPNTLTRLNTVKRDTRTIDEILRDRAKARENKTLEGEEARDFHDWFGAKPKSAPATKASSPSPVASGTSTPTVLPQRSNAMSSTTKKSSSPRPPISRTPSFSSLRPTPKTAPKASSVGTKQAPRPSSQTKKSILGSNAPPSNKRARSPPSTYDGSESDSEYDRRPHKRTAGTSNGIQDEIWKIFGRDRSKYVARDVMSDDEDMEADMTALEREELARCVACFGGHFSLT